MPRTTSVILQRARYRRASMRLISNLRTENIAKSDGIEIAKDSNVPLSTRARAAGDMVSDKIDEHKHNTSADVNKEAAKH
ncbi:Glucose-repressible protein [Loxospora ochrophaea]|nr:Glucose-repressible protein [Loxospora ochrophaea]